MIYFTESAAGNRLLLHNIRSAVEIGEHILLLALRSPDRAQGPIAAETTHYTGNFLSYSDEVRRYEMLFLAKIVRASHWFSLLRRMEPRLKREIRAFEASTKSAADVLEQLRMENPHLLDETIAPALVAGDEPENGDEEIDLQDALATLEGSYKIAGQIDVPDMMQCFLRILRLLEKKAGVKPTAKWAEAS